MTTQPPQKTACSPEKCLYEEELILAWNIWLRSKGQDRRVCWWQYQAFFRRYQEHLTKKEAGAGLTAAKAKAKAA